MSSFMGDMADYYGIKADGYDRRLKPTATIWVTREGERVKVKDMEDSHLISTIRCLRRHAPRMMAAVKMSLYSYLGSEPPDGAYDCADSAVSELAEMDADEYLEGTVPTFSALMAEAEKRGLRL